MTAPDSPAPRVRRRASPLPSPRAWLLIALAFAVGALLFLALWLDRRDDRDFFRSPRAPTDAAGQVFEPLPVPSAPQPAEGARLPQADGRPPPTADAPPPPAPPAPPAAPAMPSPPAAGDVPVAIESPPPRYPPDALRRGESGEVLLRVEVGADGVPSAVDVLRSSRSRALDRAAVAAVRRWRFRPAQRDGQPVPATVNVPITFDSGR